MVAGTLRSLRELLILFSLFTVLFTKQIPAVAVRHDRHDLPLRVAGSELCAVHARGLPPFDFAPAATDAGAEPHTTLSIVYPESLDRWKPLHKWFLAIPHYVVLFVLCVGAVVAIVIGFFAVLVRSEYPEGICGFLVGVYRYGFRVEAYVGFLTDVYPPFQLCA